MDWSMVAVCSALAYATELSLRTLRATAAFTGAARFALMSDIASRSGSSSPACCSSSSSVSSSRTSLSGISFHLPLGLLRAGLRDGRHGGRRRGAVAGGDHGVDVGDD